MSDAGDVPHGTQCAFREELVEDIRTEVEAGADPGAGPAGALGLAARGEMGVDRPDEPHPSDTTLGDGCLRNLHEYEEMKSLSAAGPA